MIYKFMALAELLFQFICLLFCKRYVFLEYGINNRKQRLYFIAGIVLIAGCFFFMDENFVSIIMVIFVGANISLSRNKHRLAGFLLVIPIMGIVNGLAIPALVMPNLVSSFSENTMLVFRFALEVIIAFLLILFYVNKQRKSTVDTEKRYLQNWEKCLLFFVGIIMMIFSNIISMNYSIIQSDMYTNDLEKQALQTDCLLIGGVAFALSITIIVLIIQGNKREYYFNKVSDMQFNLITIMADIVESRDENTGGHIKRTAKYVEIIAEKLKQQNLYTDILTEQYISDMVIAAPLHDIGKIHIPDAILNKPGRLTDEEFEIMKSHAEVGRDLLLQAKEQIGEFSYLNIAINMAAFHHEWWNGEGYPNKLKEQEIPLCARIMAVADVFDALTAKRCYKDAMPVDKAFNIIREESGTHFDPIIAEAFLDSAGEIISFISSKD